LSMKVSVLTPTHDPKYLGELYESIKEQGFYEWIILAQGSIEIPDFKDKRVKVFRFPLMGEYYVGGLKRHIFSLAKGDILLELDHDDLLTSDAIEEVKKAFEDKEVGFVYSNFANFQGNFERTERWDASFGWKYRPFHYNGHVLDEVLSFELTPASVSRIWYAPNHLRAWRKDVYEKIGGHSERMRVLDDQDLMCRTYLATKMKHIDKCLYLYRITGENTYLKFNDEIQNNVMRIYGQYIYDLAAKWSKDNSLLALDLGGRFGGIQGYQSVDLKNAEITTDLNGKWPFKDNSVGVIRAQDILEHLPDKLHVIKEIYRVLAPGGYLLSSTPSTDGRGAFQDPTHCAFYNENSFWYYTRKEIAAYIDTPVRFQEMLLSTHYPSEWHEQNDISYVTAHLVSLKDGHRPPGIINI
jgi:SAM-dependent methyltransferase